MDLSRPKKIILVPLLCLIGLLLFISLSVYPWLAAIDRAGQEYLAGQEVLTKLDQRESLAKQLEKEYQENESELADLAKVFLSTEETVGFITNLETIARRTNNFFEIKAASPHQPSEEEAGYLSFRISLWGSFHNLLLFLAKLEDSPYPPYRLVELENITIKKLEAEDLTRISYPLAENSLESILSIKIYTQ